MKSYPSIPSWSQVSVPNVYVFDKLDGSSVRCEIDRKGNITKFGKRHGLLDDVTPFLNEAGSLIPQKYGTDLAKVVRDNRWDKATFYFEFWGPSSLAGWHASELHDVTLFDVEIYKKGFLEPREFLKLFDHVDHAKLVHYGNFNHEIAEQVSQGTLQGVTFEGIVAKGARDRKLGMPLMFKWKSLAWQQRLRAICKNEAEYNQRC